MLGRHALVLLALCWSCSLTDAKAKDSGKKGAQVVGKKVATSTSLRAGTEKTVPLRTHSLYARESSGQPQWGHQYHR